MNYLVFNNNVYLDDGFGVKRLEKGSQQRQVLEAIEDVNICAVDIDVELASAPEGQVEKKDSILARKFLKLHPQNEYILQDEKIDDNIFQVIGIKAEKVREIYALIPSDKVKVFIPYAIALRNFLIRKNIELENGIIFIDDFSDEKLITVFSGQKFSVTRTLTGELENIWPEIKRSQIGFSKKIEEFDNWSSDYLTVITNNQAIADYLSKKDHNINIEYVNVEYPAIEGLQGMENSDNLVKFLLPEEIRGNKIRQALKTKAVFVIASLLILFIGFGFAAFNKIEFSSVKRNYTHLIELNQILERKLLELDINTYREDLKQQKYLNYATPYLEILNILPLSYEIYSFRYYQTGHWNLEAYIYSKDGEPFDEIPKINILNKALIDDYFIKDKPGKRIQVEL